MSFMDNVREVMQYDNTQMRRVEITLKVELDSVASASDTFKVPGDKKLVIFGIRGQLATQALNDDNATLGGVASVNTVRDIVAAKAMNCRVQLFDNDSKLKMFEDDGDDKLSLSSLMEIAGGAPIDWRDWPHVVPSDHTIKMIAELVDNATNLAGGDTEYGVVISALLVDRDFR